MPRTRRPMRYRLLLLFDQDDVLYEIANLAAAQGESSRIEDATGEKMEQFKNICEEGNRDRVLRTVPLAISKCEKILSAWTKNRMMDHLSLDNALQDKPEFVMEMVVEEHISANIAYALLRFIQEYIEVYVLEDWAGITYPEGRPYWAERLAGIEAELRDLTTYIDDDCCAIIPPNW